MYIHFIEFTNYKIIIIIFIFRIFLNNYNYQKRLSFAFINFFKQWWFKFSQYTKL